MGTVLNVGETFAGRYRLDEKLGAGGFGAVFRAVDLRSGEVVALKILRNETADPATRARFLREAQLLRRVEHPGIVEVLDYGAADDGAFFLALEYLRGEDLSALLARRGLLSSADTAHVLEQLLDALSAAHRLGIVHRDIKPENIRVIPTAGDALRLKLLDFGIARPNDGGSPTVTATGELIGTPRYMSPEQLTNRPLSPASDLYSAGIVALELLVGRNGLHGGRWGDQLERLEPGYRFPVPPQAGDPQSAHLTEVISRLTAREVAARYPTARDALAALSHDRPEARSRSHWPVAIGSAVAAAVVAGLGLWALAPEPPVPSRVVPAVRNTPAAGGAQGRSLLAAPQATRTTKDSTAPPEDPEPTPPEPRSGCGDQMPQVGLSASDALTTYVPTNYDPAARHPLLLLAHDEWVSPKIWIEHGGLISVAEEHGLVVVAPSGGSYSTLGGAWRREESKARVESAFRNAVANLCIDESRVFVLGLGHGGQLANEHSCSAWVTGAASVSHHYATYAHCDRPAPFLFVAPKDSEQMPSDGRTTPCSSGGMTFADRVRSWRERNHCSGPTRLDARRAVACEVHACSTPFVSCLADGGHGWPGAPRDPILPGPCDAERPARYDAARLAWDFFAALPPLRERTADGASPEVGDAIDTPPQSP